MDKKQCRHLRDSLSDYVDGILGEELCEEIDRHLEECQDCQVIVDSFRKTIYLYHRSAKSPTLPEDVRKRLYHRLNWTILWIGKRAQMINKIVMSKFITTAESRWKNEKFLSIPKFICNLFVNFASKKT